jgi:hypothetical protein
MSDSGSYKKNRVGFFFRFRSKRKPGRNTGKPTEGVLHLSARLIASQFSTLGAGKRDISHFKVPNDPLGRSRLLDALLVVSSALTREGYPRFNNPSRLPATPARIPSRPITSLNPLSRPHYRAGGPPKGERGLCPLTCYMSNAIHLHTGYLS